MDIVDLVDSQVRAVSAAGVGIQESQDTVAGAVSAVSVDRAGSREYLERVEYLDIRDIADIVDGVVSLAFQGTVGGQDSLGFQDTRDKAAFLDIAV